VIAANRPILILDEPQKMEGKKTVESLARFNPVVILRYSATHRTEHNKIYRLDALDAYNQKLVKKIAVRGISVRASAARMRISISNRSRSQRTRRRSPD
jgi:type III restriction enzyme